MLTVFTVTVFLWGSQTNMKDECDRREEGDSWEGSEILNRVAREVRLTNTGAKLTGDKGPFSLQRAEGTNPKCRGPEAGPRLVRLRTSKEACKAAAE